MGKIYSLITVLLLCINGAVAAPPSGYEYWLDNDYAGRKSGTMSGNGFELPVDIASLPQGIHHFSCRLKTAEEEWGSVYRKIFLTTNSIGIPSKAVVYEYWIDNDYARRKGGTVENNAAVVDVEISDVNLRGYIHCFNMRVGDGNGNWGSTYRKLFVTLPENNADRKITGYRHNINGKDLGYEKLENGAKSPYIFTVDLPSDIEFTLRDKKLKFDRDVVSFDGTDSIHYSIQFESSQGFGAPAYWELETSNKFSTTAIVMEVNTSYTFDAPASGEFTAVKFTASDRPLYFRSDSPVALDIYRDGEKVREWSPQYLTATTMVELEAGEYFGIIHNAEEGIERVTLQIRDTLGIVPTPEIEFKNGIVTISCSRDDATIYYTLDDSLPTTESILYAEPFPLDRNAVVKAIAIVNGSDIEPSAIAELVVSEFKCRDVSITYDGRYVTFTTEESDTEIRYTLDGSNPTLGEVYAGKFDAGDLNVVKAVVLKDGFMNSDFAEYSIEVYTDEKHAKTAREGILSTGYDWLDAGVLENVESYRIEGYLNADDYVVISSIKSLRHLDIEKVTTEAIPDRAFSGMKLVSVSMPENIKDYGAGIFMNNPDLCALIWNSSDINADSRLTEGVNNPNLLLYVKDNELNKSGVRNIVVNGNAASVILSDGYPFHAPLEFVASAISYTRNFNMETAIDDCAGWETLVLPFDVKEIRSAEGNIYPFSFPVETVRHFWLYAPIGTGWDKRIDILANEPYLIAMPNNPQYIEDYIIKGDVTFSADNALVEATPELMGFGYKNGATMWGNYLNLDSYDVLWVVNDESNEGYAPGSRFVKGLRNVRPFECYLTYESSRHSMPIFDSSDVKTLLTKFGSNIWIENHEICIFSGIGQRINIYDTVGKLVRVIDVTADEICRVKDLAPGIYLVGKTKIMLK